MSTKIGSINFRQKAAAVCVAMLIFAYGSIFAATTTQEQTNTPAQSTKPNKQAVKPKLTEQEIAEARQLLNAMGYWLELSATGLDASLRHALIAFQKIAGRPKTGVLTTVELEALRAAQSPAPREAGFPHIEVDLARQVLFVIELGDAPLKVLPISSGSGELFTEDGVTRRAITPTGRFKVQRKIEGWRKSPLGLLHYPSYIYGGIAIHGNPSVPATPASHGCIRIPMFASKPFSDLAVIGTVVIVYDDNPMP